MKYIYSFLILAATVIGANSCVNEDLERHPSEGGNVIKFAATTSRINSKTSYGQLSDGKWPIYWKNGDVVKVFCPQASEEGTNNATYTVSNPSSNATTYGLSGANTMMWGEEETHHFYNFYPSANIHNQTIPTDGNYVVSVPREQYAVLQDDGTYADMSAATMAGHLSKKKSEVGDNSIITLPFKPITTALDIKITAPDNPADGTTSKYDKITITSITIANNASITTDRKYLAGVFNYAPESGEFSKFTNTTTSDQVGSYTVSVKVPNIELEVGSNKVVTVTAFLLPFDLPGDLRIIVNCKEEVSAGATGTISKTIKASAEQVAVNIGKKIPVILGKLPNPIEFNYKSWMANLDDDCYVSQISLPGTHDAGAYPADSGSGITNFFTDLFAQTQELGIIEQLDAGVRVLDFRPKYRPSYNDFNIAHGAATYMNRTFDIVMDEMIKWLAKHPTEFIIILLKNEYGAGDWDSSSNKPVFLGWIKNINAKLRQEKFAQYSIAQFDPSMTLREARGKMLFMSRDYYAPTNISDAHYNNISSDWGTYQDYYTDWYGCKISGWPDNKKISEAGTKTFYIYNPDSIYSPQIVKNQHKSVGKFYYSDYYKRTILFVDAAAKETDKNNEIQAAINAAKTNTGADYKDEWYMTWLNIYGSSESRSSGHNGTTSTYIKDHFSTGTTYHRTGIVMADWIESTNGQNLVKAVVDNNFKAGGPAKKSN